MGLLLGWLVYGIVVGLLVKAFYRDSIPSGFETKRQDFSDLIINDTSGDFDAVLDVRTISGLGGPGDQTNSTYYVVDETHLKAAGSEVLGLEISNVLQNL